MKTRNDARKLVLMARVARVREIQAKLVLAQVLNQKEAQRERARQAQVHVERSDLALQTAWHGAAVDLARLSLLQELSAHVEATFVDERERLAACEQLVAEEAAAAGKRARHRERLEEKTTAAIETLRLVNETRQQDFATEAWLVRRHTEVA